MAILGIEGIRAGQRVTDVNVKVGVQVGYVIDLSEPDERPRAAASGGGPRCIVRSTPGPIRVRYRCNSASVSDQDMRSGSGQCYEIRSTGAHQRRRNGCRMLAIAANIPPAARRRARIRAHFRPGGTGP